MSNNEKSLLKIWGDKINWDKRVKAVCKPCWEIKYCPYGPLVEHFPLNEEYNEKSCRIYGHDCPVFYVAEPLTETKELRNISRSIPRKVQFRILKRDNQICSDCGKPVLDEEIEFDHIIPWSKGGPSEEYNVKLLCKTCNRKKGNKFEEKYLIENLSDHLREPAPFKFIETIFGIMGFIWDSYDFVNTDITGKDFCRLFGRRKVRIEDEKGAEMCNDIRTFFLNKKPSELKISEFNALKFRWGFVDKKFHTIQETVKTSNINIDKLYELDKDLIKRLGFYVIVSDRDKSRWLKN
jgi:hypothetical protein